MLLYIRQLVYKCPVARYKNTKIGKIKVCIIRNASFLIGKKL